MSPGDSIRELVLPVVMISANGLICLALYNRLAAITSRFRGYGRELFEVETRLLELSADSATPSCLLAQWQVRMREVLHERRLARSRARRVRDALILLLGAVIGMLLTSLLLGLGQELALPALAPLCAFLAAIVLMIAGVGLAIRELVQFVEVIRSDDSPRATRESPAPVAGIGAVTGVD